MLIGRVPVDFFAPSVLFTPRAVYDILCRYTYTFYIMYKHPAHYTTRNARACIMLNGGFRFHKISRHVQYTYYYIYCVRVKSNLRL